MQKERDADFWHLPGTDDLNYIKAQPAPVVVRVLTKRGKENRWRTKDVFSIWDTTADDWVRTANGHRKTWASVAFAERALLAIEADRASRA